MTWTSWPGEGRCQVRGSVRRMIRYLPAPLVAQLGSTYSQNYLLHSTGLIVPAWRQSPSRPFILSTPISSSSPHSYTISIKSPQHSTTTNSTYPSHPPRPQTHMTPRSITTKAYDQPQTFHHHTYRSHLIPGAHPAKLGCANHFSPVYSAAGVGGSAEGSTEQTLPPRLSRPL